MSTTSSPATPDYRSGIPKHAGAQSARRHPGQDWSTAPASVQGGDERAEGPTEQGFSSVNSAHRRRQSNAREAGDKGFQIRPGGVARQ